MGQDKHEKRHKNRLPPFVPLLIATLDAPAWHAMSHGARSLFVALKRRYNHNNHNNGRIYLSQRKAAQELHSHHNEIARWFRELQFYGFIVMVTPGVLGVEGKGKAPRWRLTELGYMKELPTRDFTHWDGKQFKDAKIKSRAGIGARSVQESRHTDGRECSTVDGGTVPGFPHISKQRPVRESHHKTRLPYTAAAQRPDQLSAPHTTNFPRLSRPRRHRERLNEQLVTKAGRVRMQLTEPEPVGVRHRPRVRLEEGI
jgi:hypothetical protein